jgi:hypothetical protein
MNLWTVVIPLTLIGIREQSQIVYRALASETLRHEGPLLQYPHYPLARDDSRFRMVSSTFEKMSEDLRN